MTENEYGCVKCQACHRESDGPVYADHIPWQSKHGIRRVIPAERILRYLLAAEAPEVRHGG